MVAKLLVLFRKFEGFADLEDSFGIKLGVFPGDAAEDNDCLLDAVLDSS